MKYLIIFSTLLFATLSIKAQVGIGTTDPSPAAALHIVPKGNQGLVIPAILDYKNVDTNKLDSKGKIDAAGLIVYSKQDSLFYMWDSSKWQCVNPYKTDISTQTIVIADPFTTISGQFTGSINGNMEACGKTNSFEGNGTIPIGGIIFWSGSADVIGKGSMSGWELCDGIGEYTDINGIRTRIPNLSAKFVVGYNPNSVFSIVGDSGGSPNITIPNVEALPEHAHDYSLLTNESGRHRHTVNYSTSNSSSLFSLQLGSNTGTTSTTNGYLKTTDSNGAGLITGSRSTASPIEEVPDHSHAIYGNTGNGNGTLTPIDILPPYYVAAYIIRIL